MLFDCKSLSFFQQLTKIIKYDKHIVLEARGYVDRVPRYFLWRPKTASKSDVYGASYGRFTETDWYQ